MKAAESGSAVGSEGAVKAFALGNVFGFEREDRDEEEADPRELGSPSFCLQQRENGYAR